MRLHFDVGEHVICKLGSKQSGSYVELDAVPTITIYDPDRAAIELGGEGVDAADMTENGTGLYEYSLATAGYAAGTYSAMVAAVHSSKITIIKGGFILKA